LPRDTRYSVLSFYTVLTFVIIFALYKMGTHLDVVVNGISKAAHSLMTILTPLVWGFVIAYLVNPVVRMFQRRLEKFGPYRSGKRSALPPAIAITFILLALIILTGLSAIISAFSHEMIVISFDGIRQFLISVSESLSSVYTSLEQAMEEANISSQVLKDAADSISATLGNVALGAGSAVAGFVSNMTGFLVNLFVAVILAMYFLADAKGLGEYWNHALRAVSTRRFYRGFHQAVKDADRVFAGYIRGQLVDALFMAVVVSIALLLLNVKFAVIIGVLTGIGNLIPYVGPFVAYGLSAFACLLEGDIRKLVLCIIILFLIQTVDGQIINPRLLSNAISVHPMLVIVALLLGSAVGGLGGMLLAVPVAALLKIWFDRFIETTVRRRTGGGEKS